MQHKESQRPTPQKSAVSHKPDHVLTFVNALSDAILLLDHRGNIFAKNRAFEKCQELYRLNSLPLHELSQRVGEGFGALLNSNPLTSNVYQGSICDESIAHTAFFLPRIFDGAQLLVIPAYDENEILQRVLDCIPARVFWKDISSRYLGANHLFLADCGVSRSEQLIGLNDYDFFPQEEASSYIADDREVMRSQQAKLNIEEPQTRPDGELVWLLTSKVPIRNQNNDVIGVMGSYTDITERKNYQQLIERQARFDELTGLPNRQGLLAHFKTLENEQPDSHGSLLFIDLDNFKTVNDTLGHIVGDKLLRSVSKRIKETAEKFAFVVRIGGDEFAALLVARENNNQHAQAEASLQLAQQIKSRVLAPYHIDSHFIKLGLSIGITYFYTSHVNWSNTFNEAYMAMYSAKAKRKNSIEIFTEEMRANNLYIYTMQKALNQAIENNELYLNIQPQYDNHGHILGAEALLRWHNDELGEVSPVEFIPLSEQSGTIHEIGMWVFEQAFSKIYQWSEKYGVDNTPSLSVNVSAKQFQGGDFLEKIEKLKRKYPVTPKLIHFELTESLLIENEIDAIKKLDALKNIGFALEIDDFGTGYSCLNYLYQLPIDKIKIDRGFTSQVVEDKRQAALVETIILMSQKLGMEIIAEGVETEQQVEFLLHHGCSEFQGYYFSRPLSCENYEYLLDTRSQIAPEN